MQKAKPAAVAAAPTAPASNTAAGGGTNNANPTAPPNFRRKRRHSEPHLSATKPYKNFVTHWKLDTKKPPNTAPSPPPTSSSSHPSPSTPLSPSSSSTSVPSSSQEHKQTSSSWSPSNSEALKSIFHPYKKDSPSTSPAPQRLSHRRGSLPHIMEGGIQHRSSPSLYGLHEEEYIDDRLQTIHESHSSSAFSSFRFPPLLPQTQRPSSAQDHLLHHERRDLAPILNNVRGDPRDKTLPSLQTLLQNVQDVSLSDDVPMREEQSAADEIEPPRSYVVRRRMSIDSLLE